MIQEEAEGAVDGDGDGDHGNDDDGEDGVEDGNVVDNEDDCRAGYCWQLRRRGSPDYREALSLLGLRSTHTFAMHRRNTLYVKCTVVPLIPIS